MSDTVMLALITAVVTIAAAVIAHLDRHHVANTQELKRELVAAELAKPAPGLAG